MKRILLCFVCFVIIFPTNAQDKLLTITDAVIGNNQHMYPTYLHQLNWRPATSFFTYVENDQIIQESVMKEDKEVLLDLKKLNKKLTKEGFNEMKSLSYYNWQNSDIIRFKSDTSFVYINIKSNKIEHDIHLSSEAQNLDFCSEKFMCTYTVRNNLFIVNAEERVTQITQDNNPDIINGGDYVHRTEFGISKATFWSPQGNYLAFYRQDLSMVTNYPLVDITTRIAEVNNIKYPMAGMKSEEVTIGIYNLETNKTIFLNTGKPVDQYLTNIAWSPDEKTIFVAVLNREQNHLKLNQYNILSGQIIKTLFEEKHEKYVEPEHPIIFNPINNNEFVWQSEKDGYNHLYLYSLNGELIKQLTKGNWVVTRFLGFDETGEFIYYTSNERSPIERNIYKVEIKTGNKILLTEEKGTHSTKFSDDKLYFIDHFSSFEIPGEYYLSDNTGKILRTIYSAENPLKDYILGEMEVFTIKNDDGIELYSRMIKPINFDPTKKYPAIIYVYGGPHSQLVINTWMGNSRLWSYYMAQKGYVILTLDNRGTAYRGIDFENSIHRQLGLFEMEDQKKGIDYLFGLDFIDTTRIGVHGWSYGGFMTISLMHKYPEIYKVGVAGGPVTDWKYYEIMYGERYMDTPQENPDGYKNSKLNDKVASLKGNLLIIHGAIDGTVVWQHSLNYISNCIKEGVPVDYFVYPEHEHNVRGKDRIHLMEKVTKYFDDNL